MNILRKALLKLARGVAREDVIPPQRELSVQCVDRPVERIKMVRVTPGCYGQYRPWDEIIAYTKQEMAREIGEMMAETGRIQFEVKLPQAAIDELVRLDPLIPNRGRTISDLTITAEAWVARQTIDAI